jgi:threonine/homoserine/homoserine lactone efflux protein
MDIQSLLVFAVAYSAVVILPGPGVTALVAHVLARGPTRTPAFIAGFAAGAIAWLLLAVTGLTVLAAAFGGFFVVVRYAGAAYLLYLAWKLWNAPVRAIDSGEVAPDGHVRLFLAGLAINLGNPKAVVFFLAVLPTVVQLDVLTPFDIAALACVIAVVLSAVFGAYAIAAARARQLFKSRRALVMANRSSSIVMAGAAAAVVAR